MIQKKAHGHRDDDAQIHKNVGIKEHGAQDGNLLEQRDARVGDPRHQFVGNLCRLRGRIEHDIFPNKVGQTRAKDGEREARDILVGLERDGEHRVDQRAQRAARKRQQQHEEHASGIIPAHEAKNRAHIHHAFYTEVQIAALFREDFPQRAIQQRHARGNGRRKEAQKVRNCLAHSTLPPLKPTKRSR